jgi:hypothetical protein
MPHDSSSNAPASGQTSKSAPSDRESKPDAPASESAFLTKQAADAKAAMARVSEELKNDLVKGVDPRAWMQVAPWTTLASAAVAGFLAAAATIPSKEEQALRRLRKMENALEQEEYDRTHDREPGRRNGHDRKRSEAGKGSMMGAVMGSLLAAVQPVLVSVLNNAMGVASAKGQPPSNGAAPGTTPPPSQAADDGGANQV